MFFGKVIKAIGTTCRIRVICKLTFENGIYSDIDYDVCEYVGETGKVFVPNNNYEKLLDNELVFFSIKDNEVFREGLDTMLLDERFITPKAFPLITASSRSVEELEKEPFYHTDITNNSTAYVSLNNRILGRFTVVKDFSSFTLKPSATISAWKENGNVIIDSGVNSEKFIFGDLDPKNAILIDNSTPAQLKNFFRKKIQNHSKNEFLPAIKTLEAFIENYFDYSNDDLEKQKWEKIRSIFDQIELEYEDLKLLLNSPELQETINPLMEKFKSEIMEDQKLEIKSKLAEYEQTKRNEIDAKISKAEEKVREPQAKLSEIKSEITAYQKELQKLREESKSLVATKELVGNLLEKFNNERDSIIQDLALFQPLINQTIAPVSTKQPTTFTPMIIGEQPESNRDFANKVCDRLKLYEISVRPQKVYDMKSAIDTFKGVIVPTVEWSRAYCDGHPNYTHIIITIDPSVKNIAELWDMYLKEIADSAIGHPDLEFYIHFDGINNSLPDIWMKSIWNLIAFKNSRVPVKGLPVWPENIKFFFSPSQHSLGFDLSDSILSLWPAICTNDVPDTEPFPECLNANANKLAMSIANIRGTEDLGDYALAQRILWDYPRSYKTNYGSNA